MTLFREGTNLQGIEPAYLLETSDGAWMFGPVQSDPGRPLTWRGVAMLAVFWVAVGLFGGTAEYLASASTPDPATWPQVSATYLLVGVLWIPLTVCIVWAGRRFPPVSLHPRFEIHLPRAISHGLASLGSGFLLNAAFYGAQFGMGSIVASEYGGMVLSTALRLMHINAGVYWVILASARLPAILTTRAEALKRAEAQGSFEETLTVRSGPQSIVVRVSDIRWIEGAGDYVRLHLGIANHLHSERLKRLESRLDPHRFVRVHRSAIVNVEAVRKLRHLGHGDYEAILDDGSTVRVSRTRRSLLTEVLEKREVGESDEGPKD